MSWIVARDVERLDVRAAWRAPAKYSRFGRIGQDERVPAYLLFLSVSLVAYEKERAVPAHAAPKRRAESIVDKFRPRNPAERGIIEEVIGIESSISKVFEQADVELVRSGPADDLDLRSAASAI